MQSLVPPQASSRRRVVVGGLGMALCACSPLTPGRGHAEPGHGSPLFLSDYGLVFTDIAVQGRPVRALVDTGSASGLRLSARLAQALQIPLTDVPGASMQGLDGKPHPVQRGQVASLELGDMALAPMDFEVAGTRIEGIAGQVGTAFDAVLGWGLLSRSRLEVDYPGRRLRFGGDPIAARSAATLALPYAEVRRLPVVEGLVAGQAVRLLVDTGAPMCNLDRSLAGAPPGEVLERRLALGAWSAAVRWRVKDLAVTRQALGSAASLGNNLLSGYVVTFDVRDRLMLLR